MLNIAFDLVDAAVRHKEGLAPSLISPAFSANRLRAGRALSQSESRTATDHTHHPC